MPPVPKPKHSRKPTKLRAWRKFKKLSQIQAAERIGIDYSTLGRIERGESPYNQDTLERLAMAYGCEPEDLLTMDPMAPATSAPRLVWDRLQQAPKDVRDMVFSVIETMLKAG